MGRQLLHHTSGLRDYLMLSLLAGNSLDSVITERTVLNQLARQKRLNFAPGAEHLYSNSGYVILSIIVNRVAGQPLDKFARERIFTPLGMRNTRFQHDHSAPIPGRVIGYVRRNETWHIANSLLDVVGDGDRDGVCSGAGRRRADNRTHTQRGPRSGYRLYETMTPSWSSMSTKDFCSAHQLETSSHYQKLLLST
jgi:CubicO group peptidase (beta-lactamase class C family)